MAKKKKEVQVVETSDDYLDRIYEEIQSEFGEGILVDGQSVADSKKTIIPVSPVVDLITSGGILEGSWVGITGNPKLGKTTFSLALAANCQKKEYGSRPIFYGDVEGRISEMHLKGIRGLDLAKGRFNLIRSRKGKILTAQEHLDLYARILRTVPNAVLIIDSISAMCDEKEMSQGVGTETRGGGAKLFSQWCRMMNNVVPVHNSIVIGITHLICDTGNAMAGRVERVARMWQYQCDYQIRAIKMEAWKSGEKQIGQKVTWACRCSKLGPPGMSMEGYLRYGTGLDSLYEAMILASTAKLIEVKGAWYNLTFLNSHPELPSDVKAQGGEATYKLLLENPDWCEALYQDVAEAYT